MRHVQALVKEDITIMSRAAQLLLRRAIHVSLVATAVAGGTVRADQTTPVANSDLETVTVFGSRVKPRTVFDSPVPIDVFSPEEVRQALSSGELGQALQALSPSINMPRASSSGTSDSIRAIQLRGLAPDQTLVLIDGKRRHSNAVMDLEGLFPGTVAVDLNAIPEEAIDHIEILRDGAGAQYGSDAIAGVVNVVLKSGATGGTIDAAYGENHTHFAPTGTTITDGRNKTVDADYGIHVGERGWLRFGADYQDRGNTNRAGRTDATGASYFSTPADLALDNQVVFRSGDPDLVNKSLYYNLDLPVGGVDLYSFTTLNWRNTKGAAFFRYPGDPTNDLNIYPHGYRPVSTGTSHDIGFVGGIKADAGGWKWDLSARDGYNTFSYGLTNSLNAALGDASPTSFHVADFTYEERAINLDVAKGVDVGAAAPLNVAAGAEFMHQAYHTSPGDPASYAAPADAVAAGIPPGSQGDNGLSPADAVHLTRSVTSAYLDLDYEVSHRLLVGVAGRYSHYSDYGSSTTGKFDVRYNLTDDFLVRAAVSNNFRAPSLAQTGLRLTTLNLNSDGTGLQNTAFLPSTDPLAIANGGTQLKPEKSVNYTAGLAWRGAAGVAASVDVFDIRIRDRITPTGQIPVNLPDQPSLGAVTFLTNGLDTTTRGLDVVISDTQRLQGGELKLSAAFNRTYHHLDGLTGVLAAPGPNAAVLIPLLYGAPATKLILDINWSTGDWGAFVRPTRFGSLYAFTYDGNEPLLLGGNAQKYGSAWTVDTEAHYNFTKQVTVAVGGANVFNRYPDRTTSGGTYYGSFPYNFVNPVGLNGAYYYARIAIKLH